MKSILPLLFLLFILASCEEEKQPLPEVYTTKKLDTVRYGGVPLPQSEKQYRFGDTIVGFTIQENEYVEHKYIANNTYSYSYDNATFLLKSEQKGFSGLNLYYKEYNAQGKLISHINFLEGYTFTPEQLALKMKNDYNVDINNPEKPHISSGKNFWGTPYYGVRVLGFGNDFREIRINGKTGEFMGEVKGQYEE